MPTKLKPSHGVSQIINWKFQENNLPEAWARHIGVLPQRWHMYIDGDGGHGKTEYSLQLSKMLATHFGKTHLNNVEQAKHPQIQESVERNRFDEIPTGKFMYSTYSDFEDYREKLRRRNSGRVQIIDSISYWPLSTRQVQELIEEFKHKSFVFVAYKAHFNQNKPIQHLCDIKVRVENFKATSSSRYGGNEVFTIWDRPKKSNGQLALEIGQHVNGKN